MATECTCEPSRDDRLGHRTVTHQPHCPLTTHAQHTPGPWTLEAGRTFQTGSGEFYLSYGKDRHGNPKFRDFCELDANARLIAAAPEMLAALERIAASEPRPRRDGHYDADVVETLQRIARAAIRKATGEGA